ncbi:MAG: hypothetical protein ACM3PU_18375 [Gemmatimonadota bacterium]
MDCRAIVEFFRQIPQGRQLISAASKWSPPAARRRSAPRVPIALALIGWALILFVTA